MKKSKGLLHNERIGILGKIPSRYLEFSSDLTVNQILTNTENELHSLSAKTENKLIDHTVCYRVEFIGYTFSKKTNLCAKLSWYWFSTGKDI